MSAALAELAGALEAALPELRLERDVRLAPYTSFAVGGPADLLLVIEEITQLERAVALANAQHVPWTVLGSGTNVLVADEGIRGLVIINAAQAYTMAEDGLLVAASGALLCELARWAVGAGWRGLQWAVGIPGTVGGAVVGNAGAYGGCMADIVRWVRVLRPGGHTEQVSVEALAYGYRTSALKREAASGERTVVLEAALQLVADDPVALTAEAAAVQAQRERSTPRGCCAGSIFKRTAHYPAGYLIDKAGLKGLAIGAAQVSPVHANFIMNTGGATAREVRQLIERVQQEVWQRYAQHLEPEVEFVGDWHWT
ncbi:MAG: UDP-N-acetylmuramate dehydrogenase [Anaerolineales bacterium]